MISFTLKQLKNLYLVLNIGLREMVVALKLCS